jgi:hypothetical protein
MQIKMDVYVCIIYINVFQWLQWNAIYDATFGAPDTGNVRAFSVNLKYVVYVWGNIHARNEMYVNEGWWKDGERAPMHLLREPQTAPSEGTAGYLQLAVGDTSFYPQMSSLAMHAWTEQGMQERIAYSNQRST